MPAMASPEHGFESKHLLGIIDSIPSLIDTGRPDGYLDYFNQPWLRYVGLPLEDLLGWKWTAAIHPEDVEGVVNRWRLSLASGEPFLHEARVRRADGDYRWMLHHKAAVRDEAGDIVKWYGSSIDIEDRKRAEEAQQRTEFFLAEGQRLSHTGGWAFNAGGFDYWSSGLFEIHGLDGSGKAPTVEEYLALVHPEDRESVVQEIQKMLARHCGFDFTKRIVRPDGKIRRVRCVGIPTAHGGTFQGFVGTGIDVTEQEELTQELRRREAYLAAAQRLSRTGSFGWRVSGGGLFWSDETFRIFQCDPSTKPTVEFVLSRVYPEDRDLVRQQIDRASRDGEGFDFEHRLQLPDGSIKHVRVTAQPSRDRLGNLEFLGAVTDVSEQRRAEAVIRERESERARIARELHDTLLQTF
jgi:PAS domain S-box-containing protein